MRIRPARLPAVGMLAALVCLAGAAQADIVKCQRTIAKAGSQYVQARAKVLAKCEIAKVAGKLPIATVCASEPKTSTAISKAGTKLDAAIDKACGGSDKVCGGGNDDTAMSIAWPSACPNFEGGDCTDPIGPGCEGIADCLRCIDDAAVDQNIGLLAGTLAVEPPPISDKGLNKCQQTIVKAGQAYLNTRTKILQKCWDARLTGKHSSPCPDPGDGKAVAALEKAEAKKVATICGACGGSDKTCGGGGDYSRGVIGFTATCPSLTVPGAGNCGGAVGNLTDIVACADCITDFKTSCMDVAQVPELAPYPTECNAPYPQPTPTHTPCPLPSPTPGSCPSSVSLTVNGPSADLDNGWTGIAHDYNVPTNGQLTFGLSACTGASPNCGECSVNGPINNPGGGVFANKRCAGNGSYVQCATDGDCITAGEAGPCVYFFGAPLPIAAGGVPVCVTNEVNGAASGTFNVTDGSSSVLVKLKTRAFSGIAVPQPCPLCVAGTCTDGPRTGQPCTVTGESAYFNDAPLSLDCPPAAGSSVGILPITLNVGTDLQTAALSVASPACRALGYTSLQCMCDTCNNATAEPCASDADCPISGGNPGVCGGRRCQSGANNGLPCTTGADCPGGSCSVPGLATAPNSCGDAVCTPDPLDTGSVDEGLCEAGPFDGACTLERYRACLNDSECNPPGCPDCIAGQTCVSTPRSCFTDNGRVGTRCYGGTNDPATDLCTSITECPDQGAGTWCGGGSIKVEGTPDPGCGGLAEPTLGTVFCVPPTSSTASNQAGGLPGPGRLTTKAVLQYAP